MSNFRFFYFDTETTGTEDDDRIITLYGQTNKDEVVDIIVKPPVPIKLGAIATTGIFPEDVKDYPGWSDKETKLVQKYVSNHVAIAHNIKFDKGMLEKEGVVDWPYMICTYKVAHHLFPEIDSHKLAAIHYHLGFREKLNWHDAETDVKALMEVFDALTLRMVEKYKFDQRSAIKMMIEITKKPLLLYRFTFGKYKGELWKDCTDYGYLEWIEKKSDLNEDCKFTANHYLSSSTYQPSVTSANQILNIN
ncbi:MAG: 3'-5' exonuclease [Cyanothece sp. SIO1E1]|nr:3'-5' exonuclease [Cyanothece sp. SIO1E1]